MAGLLASRDLRTAGALLIRCLRVATDDELVGHLASLSDTDWHSLVDEAERFGVAPLLHYRLQLRPAVRPATGASARLRDVYTYNLLRNGALLQQLGKLVSSAAAHGCTLIPLKGAHLAGWVYEEPALRPMLDLDLLARSSSAQMVRDLIAGSGYRDMPGCNEIDYARLHHLKPLTKRGEVEVEVHHALAPSDAPFRVDMTSVWARAARESSNGDTVSLLAPIDLLLHVCTHAAYNDEFRVALIAFCDIDAIVRRYSDTLDWTRLVTTANGDGRSKFAYVALHGARRLLGTAIPDDVLNALQHDRHDDVIIHEALAYVLLPAEDVPVTLKMLERGDHAASRLGTIAGGLFPPPARLRRIYGLRPDARAVSLYYLVRPLDLLWRRGRQVLQLLLRTGQGRQALERERRRRILRQWVREPKERDGA